MKHLIFAAILVIAFNANAFSGDQEALVNSFSSALARNVARSKIEGIRELRSNFLLSIDDGTFEKKSLRFVFKVYAYALNSGREEFANEIAHALYEYDPKALLAAESANERYLMNDGFRVIKVQSPISGEPLQVQAEMRVMRDVVTSPEVKGAVNGAITGAVGGAATGAATGFIERFQKPSSLK